MAGIGKCGLSLATTLATAADAGMAPAKWRYIVINGQSLIGSHERGGDDIFSAVDAASGAALEPIFAGVGAEQVDQACALAATAFDAFRELAPDDRASFLDAIADGLAALGDALIARAMAETGLPRARLVGETGRTIGQLRMFATFLREGWWLDPIIETALPDRQPVPRPDLRQRRVALGPVAVFGASNFPLAFSVAGGDTAAALAAGCPVVVKGHPAHPGTGELVGRAIRAAVVGCGLPEGVFSLLQGRSTGLGAALVADPRIKAVGFTGSRAGGLALAAIAAARHEPIPVYAEMSSVNPVLIFPGALTERAAELASGFVGSLTMGAGQFCTNPGLLLAVDGPELDGFLKLVADGLAGSSAAVMLTAEIRQRYVSGVALREAHPAVSVVGRGPAADENCGHAVLFSVDGAAFVAAPLLHEELFGASAIVVRCRDLAEMRAIVEALEGQLTITVQIAPSDEATVAPLLPLFERKAGRILANGWATGVDVGRAMVHGGPFPATTDGRSTSVGTAAIERFLRPVCYQNLPESLLPAALRTANPLGLERREY